jgi:hypothetical protein
VPIKVVQTNRVALWSQACDLRDLESSGMDTLRPAGRHPAHDHPVPNQCARPGQHLTDSASVLYAAVMAQKLDQIPTGESAILRLLGQRGLVTIRQLMEAVYPEVANLKMSSVQKLIARVEVEWLGGRLAAVINIH